MRCEVQQHPAAYAASWVKKVVSDVKRVTGLNTQESCALTLSAQFHGEPATLKDLCQEHGVNDDARMNEFVNYWSHADDDE